MSFDTLGIRLSGGPFPDMKYIELMRRRKAGLIPPPDEDAEKGSFRLFKQRDPEKSKPKRPSISSHGLLPDQIPHICPGCHKACLRSRCANNRAMCDDCRKKKWQERAKRWNDEHYTSKGLRMVKCKLCSIVFPASPHATTAMYCPECKVEVHRERERNRSRKRKG